MKVIKLSRVISCWCKVVEFLCGKLRNSADEIFLPGIVKIAHSSSNSNVARGQVRCAGLSASTANHDLNSARAHHTTGTACMRNCKFLHEHTGARGSRPWEKWGTAGARGGDRGPHHDGGTPFRSTFLLRSLCCSLLRQKSPRFKAGARLLLRGRFLPVLAGGGQSTRHG